MTTYLSAHLSTDEFACYHCGLLPYSLVGGEIPVMYSFLFDAFEFIRHDWGGPIKINSGYRCPIHNQQVGGAPYSIHLFGLALDMDCGDSDGVERMVEIVDMVCPEVRMGVYKTFIHCDYGFLINPRLKESWREAERWYEGEVA
jgi:hypothetical protein